MNIIGRLEETDVIRSCISSNRPEFLAVYGRRRVGKTYLIKEFFNNHFSFYATGVPDGNMRMQLKVFNDELIRYGAGKKAIPKDWFEAFGRLRDLLEDKAVYREAENNKRVFYMMSSLLQ